MSSIVVTKSHKMEETRLALLEASKAFANRATKIVESGGDSQEAISLVKTGSDTLALAAKLLRHDIWTPEAT